MKAVFRTVIGVAAMTLYILYGTMFFNATELAIKERRWLSVGVCVVCLIYAGWRHGRFLLGDIPIKTGGDNE